MSLPTGLTPQRSDVQGAIEFAYELIATSTAAHTPQDAVAGSVILGPLLWLAHTFNQPDVLEWLTDTDAGKHADQLCQSFYDPNNPRQNEALTIVRQRIKPCFTAPRPTIVQLIADTLRHHPTPNAKAS